MSQPPNQTSFRRGISGNPGGKPATAEVSALARRYTADWLRGLVGVVRLPVCRENAPSIVSAARELREVGYPGLTKAAPDSGPASLHLHLLAVTREAQDTVRALPAGALIDATAWQPEAHEPPLEDGPVLDEAYVPVPDERMPHEALPLWDAALGADNNEHQGEKTDGDDDALGDRP